MRPRLARLLTHPVSAAGELRDQLEIRRESRRARPDGMTAASFAEVVGRLVGAFGADLATLTADPELLALEEDVRVRIDAAGPSAPYPADWNASLALARACWLTCRASGARLVVETGVAAGFSTTFLLGALRANGGGRLHSIDFAPRTVAPADVGWLVPARLRDQWTLHRGRSRNLLPPLLAELGAIDMFIHDGLHTYPTMRYELRKASPVLRQRGVVLCDDAEGNAAFAEWARQARPELWSLVQTEFPGHYFGVALTRDT